MLKRFLIAGFFGAQLLVFGAIAGFTTPGDDTVVEQSGGDCTPEECCWDDSCEDE